MPASRIVAPFLLSVLAGTAAAQDPPRPVQDPAGPPAETTPDKGKETPPEERPEFAYVSASLEHPYVEIAGILARDARTGDLGAVVLSTCPGVGATCVAADARAGVAVVSGNPDPTWPGEVLRFLAAGATPADAIERVKADSTEAAAGRQQLVVLAADGRTAAALGERVFGATTERTAVDEAEGSVAFTTYAATGLLLHALRKEFDAADGLPLPERLLVALQKATDAMPVDTKGKRGDLTGKPVSAALVVVRDGAGRNGRGDRLVDLRVDFDLDPVARMRGLYKVWAQAHLSPALRASMSRIRDTSSPAYHADAAWLARLRSRVPFGEKR